MERQESLWAQIHTCLHMFYQVTLCLRKPPSAPIPGTALAQVFSLDGGGDRGGRRDIQRPVGLLEAALNRSLPHPVHRGSDITCHPQAALMWPWLFLYLEKMERQAMICTGREKEFNSAKELSPGLSPAPYPLQPSSLCVVVNHIKISHMFCVPRGFSPSF